MSNFVKLIPFVAVDRLSRGPFVKVEAGKVVLCVEIDVRTIVFRKK